MYVKYAASAISQVVKQEGPPVASSTYAKHIPMYSGVVGLRICGGCLGGRVAILVPVVAIYRRPHEQTRIYHVQAWILVG